MWLFCSVVSLSQDDWTLAMVERLLPSAEKKLPSISISFVFKFFAIMQEIVLAKVTSSHPQGGLQDFIKITYLIIL